MIFRPLDLPARSREGCRPPRPVRWQNAAVMHEGPSAILIRGTLSALLGQGDMAAQSHAPDTPHKTFSWPAYTLGAG